MVSYSEPLLQSGAQRRLEDVQADRERQVLNQHAIRLLIDRGIAAAAFRNHRMAPDGRIAAAAAMAAAEDPTTAWLSARVAALAPGGLTDYEPTIALARRSLEQRPDKPRWILGALLLRQGQYEAAAEELVRAYETVKTNTVIYEPWLLAITHHHLGHREEARQWLDTARRHAGEALNQDVADPIARQTLRLLRDEAENLIERSSAVDEAGRPLPCIPDNRRDL